jgi:WD40 repeat protein
MSSTQFSSIWSSYTWLSSSENMHFHMRTNQFRVPIYLPAESKTYSYQRERRHVSDSKSVAQMFFLIITHRHYYNATNITSIAVTSARFIACERWIVVGCSSGIIYVYSYDPEEIDADEKDLVKKDSEERDQEKKDPVKKTSVKKIEVLKKHSKSVNYLTVHATMPYVLSASQDGKVLIWQYGEEWVLIKTFDAKSPVMHVAFNPKDTNMFASAQDKTVKVCFVFLYMRSVINIIVDVPISISFSSTCIFLNLQIWDLHSGDCKLRLSGHSDLVVCLDYFSIGDKLHLITGSKDKTAKVWHCILSQE